MKAGDILLVNNFAGNPSVVGNLIRAGERARYGKSDYARWTHSAVVVSDSGDLVEALSEGVKRSNVEKYHDRETLVISPDVSAELRAYAVRFALGQVDMKYDVLDFAAIAFSLLTNLKVSVHAQNRFICSSLCARATECYSDHGYQYPAEAMLPADLGVYWGALSGDPLPPVWFLGRMLDRLRAFTTGLL